MDRSLGQLTAEDRDWTTRTDASAIHWMLLRSCFCKRAEVPCVGSLQVCVQQPAAMQVPGWHHFVIESWAELLMGAGL
ncbi:hypothetical protein [Neorhodopirellula lusitana]|uniref:hypothetical protein n=1 Tax=Neorhodopirellula lusitana TaxID=445327 RepID=UPI00384CDC97